MEYLVCEVCDFVMAPKYDAESLILACGNGDVEYIRNYHVLGKSMRVCWDKHTPSSSAFRSANVEVLRCLHELKALNIDIIMDFDKPIVFAAKNGYADVVSFLLGKYDVNTDLKKSALRYAIDNHHHEITRMFAAHLDLQRLVNYYVTEKMNVDLARVFLESGASFTVFSIENVLSKGKTELAEIMCQNPESCCVGFCGLFNKYPDFARMCLRNVVDLPPLKDYMSSLHPRFYNAYVEEHERRTNPLPEPQPKIQMPEPRRRKNRFRRFKIKAFLR